jgi:hypothetical protein
MDGPGQPTLNLKTISKSCSAKERNWFQSLGPQCAGAFCCSDFLAVIAGVGQEFGGRYSPVFHRRYTRDSV